MLAASHPAPAGGSLRSTHAGGCAPPQSSSSSSLLPQSSREHPQAQWLITPHVAMVSLSPAWPNDRLPRWHQRRPMSIAYLAFVTSLCAVNVSCHLYSGVITSIQTLPLLFKKRNIM